MKKETINEKIRWRLRISEEIGYSIVVFLCVASMIINILTMANKIPLGVHIAFPIIAFILSLVILILVLCILLNNKYIFGSEHFIQIAGIVTYKVEYKDIIAICEQVDKKELYIKYMQKNGIENSVRLFIDAKQFKNATTLFIKHCNELEVQEVHSLDKNEF